MSKNLYISDWHYGHKNVIRFDNRPFSTVAEMNEALVSRWNAAVKPNDTVYSLGDMFWLPESTAVPVLESLNGKIILIKGNHDRCKDKNFINRFTEIHDYLEIKDGDRNVVLCHYPMPFFKSHFYGWYHLYGHVHNSFEWELTEQSKLTMQTEYNHPCNMFNVGAMMPYISYTPRTLDEIIATGNPPFTSSI